MRRLHNKRNFLRSMKTLKKAKHQVKENNLWQKNPVSNKKNSELPKARKIRPFILTCDKRIDELRKFVKEYSAVSRYMLDPVLIVDDSNPETREDYHDLLLQLNPFAVIAQPRYKKNDYENLQYFMVKDFPKWALLFSKEDIVFIEDDAEFSSDFALGIKEVSRHLQKNADIITLYARGDGHQKYEKYRSFHFMKPINGKSYYGNICVAISRDVLIAMKKEWQFLLKYPQGWDIRWGNFWQKKSFRIYETKVHYANHSDGYSAISGKDKNEHSNKFKK